MPTDMIGILVEQKEFQNDVQRTLKDVSEKVEEVHRTVQIFGGRATREGSYGATTGLTPILLLQTIQKMMDENELLKKEVSDKSNKMDILRYDTHTTHTWQTHTHDTHNTHDTRADGASVRS